MSETRKPFIVIGQAPASAEPGEPLGWQSASGRRLRTQLMMNGISRETMDESFHFMNVVDKYPGKTAAGKYDNIPHSVELKKSIQSYLQAVAFHRPIAILACGTVACAMVLGPRLLVDVVGVEHCHTAMCRRVKIFVVSHPAGTSRWRNDPGNAALEKLSYRLFSAEYLAYAAGWIKRNGEPA